MPLVVRAEEPLLRLSPNKELQAYVVSVSHDDPEESYDIVKIYRSGRKVEITEYPLIRNKDGMARQVYDAKWSPDSRFFVFVTKYVAGHSIWHSPTSVYDSKNNKFWDLDSYLGSFVSSEVKFTGPDSLKIEVSSKKEGEPALQKTISLSRLISDLTDGKE